MESNITVIIKTINRPTLINSINSAVKELENVIVVADSVDLNFKILPKNIEYYKVNRKFDRFGTVGNNVGAFLCKTPYICLLDDDDEFLEGAGDYMRSKIKESPDVDVWIPGLLYNNGSTACLNPGMYAGNIAVPTYRTELLFDIPYTSNTVPRGNNEHHIDFFHVKKLYDSGYKISWYNKLLYNIRPHLQGLHGTFNKDI